MNLFSLEAFTLPSGRTTYFKIECDVLTKRDWDALARLAVELLPPFSAVEGVPRGGIAFAQSLEPYCVKEGKLLIADDVWVSGKSMREFREKFTTWAPALGIVAFSRNPVDSWVTSLVQLHPEAEDATYQLGHALRPQESPAGTERDVI